MEPDYFADAVDDIATASSNPGDAFYIARAQAYATLAVAQAIRHQTAAMTLDEADRAALDELREREWERGTDELQP